MIRSGVTFNRLAVIVVGVAGLIAGCNKSEPTPLAPRGVVAYQVRAETTGGSMVYSGEVRPRVETSLGFRIAGKMVERRVAVGDRVQAGQLLARLDPTDPVLAAQAAGSQQAAAEAELELARADALRFASLRERNYVSQAALDARQASVKAADNRAAAARAQATSAGNLATYADLVADVAGVVSAVLAEPGQVLAVGAPVIRIARLGGRETDVLISVAENRVRDVSSYRDVSVALWANREKRYRGRVREISPQADPVTRTFAVKIAVLDADDEVRLGMTATVTFGGAVGKTLVVPAPSIVQHEGKPAVWVLGEGGTLTLRPVGVAAYREDGVSIMDGLQAGERIVAAGGHKLLPGERVRVLETR